MQNVTHLKENIQEVFWSPCTCHAFPSLIAFCIVITLHFLPVLHTMLPISGIHPFINHTGYILLLGYLGSYDVDTALHLTRTVTSVQTAMSVGEQWQNKGLWQVHRCLCNVKYPTWELGDCSLQPTNHSMAQAEL